MMNMRMESPQGYMTSDPPVFIIDGNRYTADNGCRVAVDIEEIQPEIIHGIDRYNIEMIRRPPRITVSVFVPIGHDLERVLRQSFIACKQLTYIQDNWSINHLMFTNIEGTQYGATSYYDVYNGEALSITLNDKPVYRKTKQDIIHEIMNGEKSAHIKRKDGLDILL